MVDMTASSQSPQPKGRKLRQKSWWIPWLFVAGFGVVLAANGTMLVFALNSFTGIETEQAYQKGLAFNDQIAAAERQADLGWKVVPSIEQKGAQGARIEVAVNDDLGRPLDGAMVEALLFRPTQAGHDTGVTLTRSGPGLYDVDVTLPLSGVWDLRIDIRHDRGDYRLTERLVLK